MRLPTSEGGKFLFATLLGAVIVILWHRYVGGIAWLVE